MRRVSVVAVLICLVAPGCSTGVSELTCQWDNELVYFSGTYVLDAWALGDDSGDREVTIDCYAYDENYEEVCHSEIEIEVTPSEDLEDVEEPFTCACRLDLLVPPQIHCQAISEDD